MSRLNNKLIALAVLVSLEFLSPGFFTNEHAIPTLNAAAHARAGAVTLASPAETDDGFFVGNYGEPAGFFLTAEENVEISFRRFVIIPPFFRIILSPKVSRYISKSVLNL